MPKRPCRASASHVPDFVDVDDPPLAKDGEDDGEPDIDLRRGESHDQEDVDVSVRVAVVLRAPPRSTHSVCFILRCAS